MLLKSLFKEFLSKETGAVSTDVFIVAAAGGFLSITVMAFASSGTEQLQEDRKFQIKAQEKITTF